MKIGLFCYLLTFCKFSDIKNVRVQFSLFLIMKESNSHKLVILDLCKSYKKDPNVQSFPINASDFMVLFFAVCSMASVFGRKIYIL